LNSSRLYNGLLVAISSPSGGGKTSLIQDVLKDKALPFSYSVSMTTRPRREGEIDGQDYLFVDEATFRDKIEKNEFIEYEQVHGYYYGTPRQPLMRWLTEGRIVLFDIDVKGALQIRNYFKHNTLLIFLAPPDIETLKKRLQGRDTETREQIQKRLHRVDLEMEKSKLFDQVVVNQNFGDTVRQVKEIINKRFYMMREV
jgi:guanylate kinase